MERSQPKRPRTLEDFLTSKPARALTKGPSNLKATLKAYGWATASMCSRKTQQLALAISISPTH
eukprot:739672-Pelagomonas_calceolata.AAC.1